MDIVFQSGEFVNYENPIWTILGLVSSFLAIVLSSYIAIWIFKKGIEMEKQKDIERLKELEEYIKISVANLYEPIEKQIKSLKLFVLDLCKEGNLDHSPEGMVSLHTRNIRWISQEEIHKIFVTQKDGSLSTKSELLRKLNADLDYIDIVSETLKEHFSFFMRKYEKYEEEWNSSMKKMSEIKDRMQIEFEIIRNQNTQYMYSFLSNLNQLYNTWTQQPDYKEWHIAVRSFLTPLESLCRATNGDHNALTILSLGTDCIYANTNVVALKYFIRQTMVFKIRRLRRAERRLRQVMDLFSKM